MTIVVPSTLSGSTPWPTCRDLTALCERFGMTESRFGRVVVGDPCLIPEMRRGREIRSAMRRKLHAYVIGRVMEVE